MKEFSLIPSKLLQLLVSVLVSNSSSSLAQEEEKEKEKEEEEALLWRLSRLFSRLLEAFLLDHRCHLNQPRLDCSDRQTLSFSSAGEDLRRFRSFPPREEKVLDHHGCVFSRGRDARFFFLDNKKSPLDYSLIDSFSLLVLLLLRASSLSSQHNCLRLEKLSFFLSY